MEETARTHQIENLGVFGTHDSQRTTPTTITTGNTTMSVITNPGSKTAGTGLAISAAAAAAGVSPFGKSTTSVDREADENMDIGNRLQADTRLGTHIDMLGLLKTSSQEVSSGMGFGSPTKPTLLIPASSVAPATNVPGKNLSSSSSSSSSSSAFRSDFGDVMTVSSKQHISTLSGESSTIPDNHNMSTSSKQAIASLHKVRQSIQDSIKSFDMQAAREKSLEEEVEALSTKLSQLEMQVRNEQQTAELYQAKSITLEQQLAKRIKQEEEEAEQSKGRTASTDGGVSGPSAVEYERLTALVRSQREQMAEIRAQHAVLQEERNYLAKELELASQRAARLEEQKAALEANYNQAQMAAQQAVSSAESCVQTLQVLQGKICGVTLERMELEKRVSELQARVQALNDNLAEERNRTAALVGSLAEMTARCNAAEEAAQLAASRRDALAEQFQQVVNSRLQLSLALDALHSTGATKSNETTIETTAPSQPVAPILTEPTISEQTGSLDATQQLAGTRRPRERETQDTESTDSAPPIIPRSALTQDHPKSQIKRVCFTMPPEEIPITPEPELETMSEASNLSSLPKSDSGDKMDNESITEVFELVSPIRASQRAGTALMNDAKFDQESGEATNSSHSPYARSRNSPATPKNGKSSTSLSLSPVSARADDEGEMVGLESTRDLASHTTEDTMRATD